MFTSVKVRFTLLLIGFVIINHWYMSLVCIYFNSIVPMDFRHYMIDRHIAILKFTEKYGDLAPLYMNLVIPIYEETIYSLIYLMYYLKPQKFHKLVAIGILGFYLYKQKYYLFVANIIVSSNSLYFRNTKLKWCIIILISFLFGIAHSPKFRLDYYTFSFVLYSVPEFVKYIIIDYFGDSYYGLLFGYLSHIIHNSTV